MPCHPLEQDGRNRCANGNPRIALQAGGILSSASHLVRYDINKHRICFDAPDERLALLQRLPFRVIEVAPIGIDGGNGLVGCRGRFARCFTLHDFGSGKQVSDDDV